MSKIVMGTPLNRVAQSNILPPVCSYLTMPDPEITRPLALGTAINRVAAALSINLGTVRTHRMNIPRKLNLRASEELIKFKISTQASYLPSIPIIQMACSEPPLRFDFDEDLAKLNGKTN